MLSCEDGIFVGRDSTSSLWDFAMEKMDRSGLVGSRNYYFYVRYDDGEEFSTKRQQQFFQVLRDFRNPNAFNRFKQTIQRNRSVYIECVTDTITFRIGTPDTFNIFDEDDEHVNIKNIAGNGIRKLKGFWIDQII